MTLSAPPSLRALLVGSVDYAGLFPPAGLGLEAALDNYAAYTRGDNAWMLGRFVLPITKLPEAAQLLARRFDSTHPLRISALGSQTNSAEEFLDNLRTSLGALVSFSRAHGAAVEIDQLETPLPPEITPGPVLGALLWQAAGLMEAELPRWLRTFWEIPFSDDLPAMFSGFADYNAQVPPAARGYVLPRFRADGGLLDHTLTPRNFRCQPFAVKLRTGGTVAAAFPTPQQLATALLAARETGVALKFTAGLHHPLRRFDAALGTRMHGFLNVLAAGILVREHRFHAATILEDERPENFRFDAEGFAWRDRHVPTAALAAHREFVTSFGSCSFDEPCDDLRRLGLLT